MQQNEAAAVVAITTAAEPDGAPRVEGLDILRGIAILGILFMNINDMGASFFNWGLNVRHVGWTGADQLAWALREVLADGTARCLLEMLFGVGRVILTDRAATALGETAVRPGSRFARAVRWLFGPWPVMRAYYWRNLVLFLFGLIHLWILLWPGDILHTYGIAAMVAFLFRRLGPKTLLTLGLVMAVSQLFGMGYQMHASQARRAHVAELRVAAHSRALTAIERKDLARADKRAAERAKQRVVIDRRLAEDDQAKAAATGTALSWARSTWAFNGFIYLGIGPESAVMEPLFIWEAVSTMLIGAALFRWGIMQGRRSRRFYLGLLIAAYTVGLGLRTGRTIEELRFLDDPSLWYATSEIARLATTLGHVSLVWVLLGTGVGARLLAPFAAAGRTALSLYLCQTLVCLWLLFPPFGLGLYGKLGWMSLMLTAAAIDVGLLLLANWWARRFAIAPVEWAWRSIVTGRRLPFRGQGGVRAGAVPLPA